MNKKENLREFFRLKEIMNNNFDEFKVKFYKEVSAIPNAKQLLNEYELEITMEKDYNYSVNIVLNHNLFYLYGEVLNLCGEKNYDFIDSVMKKNNMSYKIGYLNQELEELHIRKKDIDIMNNFIHNIETYIDKIKNNCYEINKELNNKGKLYKFFHNIEGEKKLYDGVLNEIIKYKKIYLEPLKIIFDEKFIKDIFKTISEEYNAINGTNIPLIIDI